MAATRNAREIVMSFVKALNDQDFKAARNYTSDNLSFSAPLASHDKADPYLADMERLRIKFDVKKVFADGNDVCLLYDFTSGPLSMYGCGWYHIEKGKISSLKVIYDPRPIIEMLAKK